MERGDVGDGTGGRHPVCFVAIRGTPDEPHADGSPPMIKSALVTGAGGGLGRAVALALASRGCAVVALDIVASAAEETAAEAGSGLITPLGMDLTAPGAAELAVVESL